MSKSLAEKKIQVIDLARSFSILSVMAQHLRYNCQPSESPWLKNLWMVFCTRGSYGVSLFFVVSGFLITRLIDQNLGGLSDPDLRSFYVRRMARVLPLLFLMLAVGLLFLQRQGDSSEWFVTLFKGVSVSFNFVFWLSILTFCFNWLIVVKDCILHQSSYGIHWAVLWSLSIEEQFYLIYPLALKYGNPRRYLTVLLFILPCLGLAFRWMVYRLDPHNFLLGFFNSFSGFEEISIGITLYLAFKKFEYYFSREKKTAILLCVLGILIFAAIYAFPLRTIDFIWEPTLYALGLFIFLMGGLNLEFFNSPFLRAFSFPGRLSYGMYLWHTSILYLLLPWISRMPCWTAFGVFVLATVLFSMFTYYLFEMPLNRKIRGLLKAV